MDNTDVAFTLKAKNYGSKEEPPDRMLVKAALSMLADPEHGCELRRLPGGYSVIMPGGDVDGLTDAAIEMGGGATGVYFGLNPVAVDLRLPVGTAPRSEHIIKRRWFFIDVDPRRPADTNATEDEKEQAAKVITNVNDYLTSLGWPDPVAGDSGNGFHLLYRVDCPADAVTHALFKRTLYMLAEKFTTEQAEFDRKVHNASRICKLPGTWARKGPHSENRPHRMARISWSPKGDVGIVPLAKFQELVALLPPPAPRPAAGSWDGPAETPVPYDDLETLSPPHATFRLRATGESHKAYARAALDSECRKLAICPVGDRNNQLNAAAFSMGTLVAAGAILENEVIGELDTQARLMGLGEHEIRGTIRSGMEAGKLQPRQIPERNGQHSSYKAAPGPQDPNERIIIRGSEIKPKRVNYLWPDRLPRGHLTTFAGMTGMGKTFVTCDIIARVTQGLAWPDLEGECAAAGQVLFISGDDEPDDTIVPRLIECGANVDKVCFLTEKAQGEWSIAALDTLDRALEQMSDEERGHVHLIVIDPPTSFMAGIDDHSNVQLRSVLTPFKSWTARHKIATILITHVNKGGGVKLEAIKRVMGSVAWVSSVRSAFMFLPDPNDPSRQLFLPLKMNLGPKPKGLAYRISPTAELARVEWLGTVDTTADEAINSFPSAEKRSVSASKFLIERFKEKREWPSEDLFRMAAEEGISRSAMFEAKTMLCLPRARQTMTEAGDKSWVWWVAPDWPHLKAPEPESPF